jgi:tetratricopeptide (TPR) repeat protein
MTVKEVFELRKQGRIEEAYDAIRPMYAAHKGHYTTLAMFWTASDILKKRIEEKRIGEAGKIFEALMRVLPQIDDRDGKAQGAVLSAALRLKEALPGFKMLDFIGDFGVARLTDEDWKNRQSQAGHALPSTAQRLLTACFHEIQDDPSVDNALKVMQLLEEAVRRNSRNKNTQRYMAVVYRIMGEQEKAAAIYRQLLARYHDSYLYAELAALTSEPGPKAALLCRAIQNQRQEKFCVAYRLSLAKLLVGHDDRRAAYELQRCLATRQAEGYHLTRELQSLQSQLSGATPATDAQQQDFYRRMIAKFPV